MRVDLAYGSGRLAVELPNDRTTVIEPIHTAGLPDERSTVVGALEKPIGTAPLREWAARADKVCILFTDLTRATPNERLIPWLLEYLSHIPRAKITLLCQTGTHRPCTPEELERMLTPRVAADYRVLNHDCRDRNSLVALGHTRDGVPALLNRHFVEADLRVVTGFIEPHFFAGFSGGPKAIMPGIAGLETVMSNHGTRNLSDPNAAFGITVGNPLWEELAEIASRPGPSFLLNVTLNTERQITGVFAGDLIEAHKAGCEFVRKSAMRKCEAPFDIVVTSNSGYPLDLNLYQGVKGMSAGARVLKPGGTLILACECREGIPAGSSYDRILRSAPHFQALRQELAKPGPAKPEQWQVQVQATVQSKGQVLLHSSLSDEATKAAHLVPCHDIETAVQERLAGKNGGARIAVLPEGPLTIPYIEKAL